MDLVLYARVLMRHKRVLAIGLLLAFILAIFSYYRVELAYGVVPKLTPREAEVWQSDTTVFLTESGFPAGRLSIPLVTRRVGDETITVPRYNDPGRFTGLAALYARLAGSDEVQRRVDRQGPPFGQLSAFPAIESASGVTSSLPMVSLLGRAASPGAARVTVTRGLKAFLSYVAEQQTLAGIPEGERIQFRVVNAPQPAVLLDPRKKTLPIVVFLSIMIAAIAVAFILENRSLSTSRQPIEIASARRQDDPLPVSEKEPAPVHEAEPEREPEPEPEAEPEPEVRTIRRWA